MTTYKYRVKIRENGVYIGMKFEVIVTQNDSHKVEDPKRLCKYLVYKIINEH